MHNIRPAVQMWAKEAFNLAHILNGGPPRFLCWEPLVYKTDGAPQTKPYINQALSLSPLNLLCHGFPTNIWPYQLAVEETICFICVLDLSNDTF